MRNDLKKIDNIDFEMRINDMVYKKMQYEFDFINNRLKKGGSVDEEHNQLLLNEHYFFMRVLSVLQNNDIPERSCMGLFLLYSILTNLYRDKTDFIGESDSDSDIYKYVVEYGYRRIDDFCKMDTESLRKRIREVYRDYYKYCVSGGDSNGND